MAANDKSAMNSRMRRRMNTLLLDTTILLGVSAGSYRGVVVGNEPRRLVVGEAVEAVEVGGNAVVEPVGDALALVALAEEVFVTRIADEGNLRKHGGHVGADQHDERSFLHATILLALAHSLQTLRERILDVVGQFLRFFDFFVSRDFLDDVLQIVERSLRERIFA